MRRELIQFLLAVEIGLAVLAADTPSPAADTPAPAAQAGDLQSIDSLLAQTEAKVKDVRDVVGDMKMTVSVPGVENPVTVVGTMKVLPPGMLLLDGKAVKPVGSDVEPPLRSIKIVCKGNLMYQELAATNKENSSVVKIDEAEIAKIKQDYADVPDFHLNVPPPLEFVHFLKDRKARGLVLKVVSIKDSLATIECAPTDGGTREVAVIDLNDGLVRKVEYFVKDQRSGMFERRSMIELSNLRTNTGLKESEFDYTPPVDFQVIDAAEFFKEMAENARKWAKRQKQEEQNKPKEKPEAKANP